VLASRDGFTLIEVLVAMVILAVGLLGLEALGIGAARSVALAERNSRAAEVAQRYLEDAIVQLRAGDVPGECDNVLLANGMRVAREVVPGERSSVTVTILPRSGGVAAQPYTITSYVFRQAVPSSTGRDCPTS
jgi:prepilin-type N-terminal cleavage/methylation domain-containing protein